MPMQRKPNSDNVRAVGEVNGCTVQVLQPDLGKEKFMWRIIRESGKNVTSGMILYDDVDTAFQAAIQVIIPDAVSVEFTEPTEADYERLHSLLFGFKKAAPISTFHEALAAHNFLIQALATLREAREVMPRDYDDCIDMLEGLYHGGSEAAATLNSLKELAIQQQNVMIELCERDLGTLSSFISAFLHL